MPMTAPTALIADDEPALARALVRELAAAWPELQVVAVARHGVEAAEALRRLAPDVAFLDIQMPGLTGLEVAQGLEAPTRVVFVTAYDQYAVQACDEAAVDYLLKPVSPERLARTVQRLRQALAREADAIDDGRLWRALQRLQHGEARGPFGEAGTGATRAPAAPPPMRWVLAQHGDLAHQVPVEQVLCFEADDKYTVVHTLDAEHLIRTPITELIARLDPEQFWQVHRATIVNLAHVAGTRRDEASRLWLRLRGWSRELPVSRAHVHRFKAM